MQRPWGLYEGVYWIKWARLLSPLKRRWKVPDDTILMMHKKQKGWEQDQCVRGRMRMQGDKFLLNWTVPLKSKSVKTWDRLEKRRSEGGLFCTMGNLLSTYRRIWLQDDRNKVESKFETYCSTTVRCGHGQIRQCQRCLTSDSCTSNLTQNPNQCGTSLHNGEIAMARHVNVWRWKSCLYIQRC